MRNRTLISCCLFLASGAALAGDASLGRYWLGGGVGSVECPNFVASMERAKKHGLGSIGYVNETQGYIMFISGFQTAYNLQTPNTCDIFSSLSTDQLLAWSENYCRSKPLEKFGLAVVALAKEVHPKRAQSCK
jgi:hypothetical protein